MADREREREREYPRREGRERGRDRPRDLGFSEGGHYGYEGETGYPDAGRERRGSPWGEPGRAAREGGFGYARDVDLRGEARYGYVPGGVERESARGPYTGRGPKGYQRSDERIREDVCERLTEHGQIDASDIECRVQDGEVTLTGTVNDRRAKRMAEDAIESVSGIKDVHNQLRIKQGARDVSGLQGQTGQEGQHRDEPRGGRAA